jgi:hypothetical protein
LPENTPEENTKFALWFLKNADFGPAHDDVMTLYMEQFERETGIHIYGYED